MFTTLCHQDPRRQMTCIKCLVVSRVSSTQGRPCTRQTSWTDRLLRGQKAPTPRRSGSQTARKRSSRKKKRKSVARSMAGWASPAVTPTSARPQVLTERSTTLSAARLPGGGVWFNLHWIRWRVFGPLSSSGLDGVCLVLCLVLD